MLEIKKSISTAKFIGALNYFVDIFNTFAAICRFWQRDILNPREVDETIADVKRNLRMSYSSSPETAFDEDVPAEWDERELTMYGGLKFRKFALAVPDDTEST